MEQYPNTKANYLYIHNALITGGQPLLKAFQSYYLRQTCFHSINQYNRWGHSNTSWNHTTNGRVPSCSQLLDAEYCGRDCHCFSCCTPAGRWHANNASHSHTDEQGCP